MFYTGISDIKEEQCQDYSVLLYDLDVACEAEFYSHYRNRSKEHLASRFMLVVDNEIALIADRKSKLQEWNGTMSNNALFIKILSEHIHNDIYLLKLRNRYGEEIYDSNLYLKTAFEEGQKEEAENENHSIGVDEY